MSYLLVIWTVVAVHGTSYGYVTASISDWRPIGAFASEVACLEASRALNLKPTQFRCLAGAAKS